MQITALLADDMRPEIAVRPLLVALMRHTFRQIENQRDRQAVVLPRQLDKRLPRFALHVRRVHHRQLPGSQPPVRE